MEYAPLTWSSCPPLYLSFLNKVQARAQRLIRLKALQVQLLPPLQPLQQRRDVAGLCVVYKTHKQHVPHLAALRHPWARPHRHTTRTAATRDHQLIVPFARTETSLRFFLPRYIRMWNRIVQQTQLHSTSSLQTFMTRPRRSAPTKAPPNDPKTFKKFRVSWQMKEDFQGNGIVGGTQIRGQWWDFCGRVTSDKRKRFFFPGKARLDDITAACEGPSPRTLKNRLQAPAGNKTRGNNYQQAVDHGSVTSRQAASQTGRDVISVATV
ncbi:hypothetical protein GWK47_027544 [Chionoecetes opilio]|uniref:Uncharacterized protein n=1 Tax=Chionoecetes opilio TaxID=41210 RepID=A0A8J8WBY5_CHIOP|nr:hypothetical protein GWK47_027544 [Chionoecetes opilio]